MATTPVMLHSCQRRDPDPPFKFLEQNIEIRNYGSQSRANYSTDYQLGKWDSHVALKHA